MLRNTVVSEVRGVWRKMKAHLEVMNIRSAMDLTQVDPAMLLQKLSGHRKRAATEMISAPGNELFSSAASL